MSDTPTREPREFTAGETVVWEQTLDDYSSADGWALQYYFRGAGKFDVTAEAQGDGSFLATIAADAEVQPGLHYWQAWVELDGEKHVVGSGECLVKQGLAGDVGTFDGRSEAKQTLDAIDAQLRGKATLDQQQYIIAGGGGYRMLARIPVSELLSLRKEFARQVARERRRERVKRGGTLFSNVKVRFTEPS